LGPTAVRSFSSPICETQIPKKTTKKSEKHASGTDNVGFIGVKKPANKPGTPEVDLWGGWAEPEEPREGTEGYFPGLSAFSSGEFLMRNAVRREGDRRPIKDR
jgi:hypothetical protein